MKPIDIIIIVFVVASITALIYGKFKNRKTGDNCSSGCANCKYSSCSRSSNYGSIKNINKDN
ncbi:MAG: FeoB-associated Cys-rich membrane protein [Tissierellia bacterium]|nr:FeoB-associated Cys-rich membrane protein [Tissierellia bacterium]